ncbi:FAD-dependent thymidylate synthase [Patescibacteria group bacterium]
MIKVSLVTHTDIDPIELASHAALICYQAETPEMGKKIDVENRLFKVGHHTTLQHFFATFTIEGIAVSDITFGMHLASPFYNSDQKSGRYCAKMFLNPNYDKIEGYVKRFWPEIKSAELKKIIDYVRFGVETYHSNINEATKVSRKFLEKERPYINDKALEMNAPKIAQEQMRMFIPTIFPTSFDFTVNLTTLVAMYESAWTPAMKYATRRMVKLLVNQVPSIKFMFNEKRVRNDEWAMEVPSAKSIKVKYKPGFKLLNISGEDEFIIPNSEMMHPVDKLHFLPEMMDNSFGEIKTQVEISTATMGQDQRHRTIGRSQPRFTGNFYLPPVPKALGLKETAIKMAKKWSSFSGIPETLKMILAPYGAMVTYKKRGSFNAVAHEQGKRLCWCAQEEIYHAGRFLRLAIKKENGNNSKLLRMLEPPCYANGKCGEGTRYCGRDMKIVKPGDYFPVRRV